MTSYISKRTDRKDQNTQGKRRTGFKLFGKRAPKPKTSGMSAEEKEDALFANVAYDSPSERKDQGDFKYDRALSDKRTGVYHNKKTGVTRLALRGTDPTDVGDLALDAALTAGKQRLTGQYRKDLADFEKVKKKYGGTVVTSGHSLGANRAQNLSKEKGIRAAAFNTGRGVDKMQLVDKLRCSNPIKRLRPKFCGKLTTHLVSGDPISTSERALGYGKVNVYAGKGGALKRHSMQNFV